MIATLGPNGTFSELACKNYTDEEILFCKNIKEVFDAVEFNKARIGMVPVENMLDGSVGETLDLLHRGNVYVIDEVLVEIHMYLAGKNSLNDIEVVMSKDKALGQCLDFIRKHNFEIKETLSTAEAMKIVSESEKKYGAIGTKLAAGQYGLKILAENIEDFRNNVSDSAQKSSDFRHNKNNITRFFVISKKKKEKNIRKNPDKKYKTSIAIKPNEDRPGLLHDLLQAFAKRNINLTKIESRPTKINLGEYIFYIDFEGHEKDEDVKKAFEELRKLDDLKIFGSYEKKF